MWRLVLVVACLVVLRPATANSAGQPLTPDQLKCDAGPITKMYGGNAWLVYGCNDGRSINLVSAPGSEASPFVFIFHWENGEYRLAGAGTGSKVATDAALNDLAKLSQSDVESLLAETARH